MSKYEIIMIIDKNNNYYYDGDMKKYINIRMELETGANQDSLNDSFQAACNHLRTASIYNVQSIMQELSNPSAKITMHEDEEISNSHYTIVLENDKGLIHHMNEVIDEDGSIKPDSIPLLSREFISEDSINSLRQAISLIEMQLGIFPKDLYE